MADFLETYSGFFLADISSGPSYRFPENPPGCLSEAKF